ncbi:ROK family transcriptional regulator [Cytobacillus firmus]|uniref:ROK family transcriptional regulator n=1 Tax=Cytobacillus firmus TaxID=1399 RepID=UPI003002B6E6
MKTDPKSIKLVILSGIRRSLIDLGSATKAELSDKLGISFPTISKFLSQMEKEGEILSAGLDESSGGRRAKRYTYNPDYMLGLAIFLEKTETNYAIFNCAGEVKEQGTVQSVLTEGGLDLLTSSIEALLMANQAIRSLAIGVPGSVKNGRIFYIPGYEQFQDFDIKGYYENLFSKPVVVENDMNAAVLGYHHHKGIKNHQSLVYLYSGQNGPGAGFMINGDVVRGNTFFAGEVSFVPQYDDFNFREALENGNSHKEVLISGSNQIDAISRLVASITAIINPHTFIFCKDEVGESLAEKIAAASSKYIPSEHLPVLAISDWKQDYLYGLQSLGLSLMLDSPEKNIRK